MSNELGKAVNLGRHKRNCSICAHKEREQIEADFTVWKSPALIADDYGLSNRASVYRHAHAFGLFEKRRRNVRAALERIIEKAGEVEVTSSAVVAAVQALTKINPNGSRAHCLQQQATVKETGMTNKLRETLPLPATPMPGDFAIGSTESRAAARMLAESKNKPKQVRKILFVDPNDNREPRLLRRLEGADLIWEMWGYNDDA